LVDFDTEPGRVLRNAIKREKWVFSSVAAERAAEVAAAFDLFSKSADLTDLRHFVLRQRGKTQSSRRSAANRDLVDDTQQVHREAGGCYGSARIHTELRAQGRGASRCRIERLMHHHGIRAIMARPRRVRTTDSGHEREKAKGVLTGREIDKAKSFAAILGGIAAIAAGTAGAHKGGGGDRRRVSDDRRHRDGDTN
jgi:transposase InsO family protein